MQKFLTFMVCTNKAYLKKNHRVEKKSEKKYKKKY